MGPWGGILVRPVGGEDLIRHAVATFLRHVPASEQVGNLAADGGFATHSRFERERAQQRDSSGTDSSRERMNGVPTARL